MLSKYLLDSETCVVLIFSVYAWIFVCRFMVISRIHFSAVDEVSSLVAVENCGFFRCNPSLNNYPCAAIFSIASHLDIYFDFAHRPPRLNFLLFVVLSFRCTSVCDSYGWACLSRLELSFCPSSLSISATRVTSRTSASANLRLEGGGTPVAAGSSYPVERTLSE